MECFFKDILKSCHSEKILENNFLSDVRILKIVSCSKERRDILFSSFENTDSGLKYHGDCYREYTSKDKISRWLNKIKKQKTADNPPGVKQLQRYKTYV